MNRKQLWIFALMGLTVLALPAVGQSYSYQLQDGEKANVWVSAEPVADDGEPAKKTQVRIVLVGEDGEPESDDWKRVDGKLITLEGDKQVQFIEDLTSRGYLGVQLVELTPELREHYGATAETGVLVGKVEPGSPAEAAGLRVGDVISGLDGEAMKSSWDIRRHIRALEEGETVAIEVYRDGTRLDLTADIVVKERPEVDIRRFLGQLGDQPFSYRVDPGQMGEAIIDLKQRFDSPEFKARVLSFSSREKELEEKLQALEKKLEELARKLEEKQ